MDLLSPASAAESSRATSTPPIQVRLIPTDPPLQGEDGSDDVADVGLKSKFLCVVCFSVYELVGRCLLSGPVDRHVRRERRP
ncbi:hypothetical protein LINGRAHAP2_LOCUS28322 [Linum grandiflorum]